MLDFLSKLRHKCFVAGYRGAMSKIISNRKEGIQDESQLKLTGQVLMSNPDIHTLWNIRKECVINKTEAIDDDTEKDGVWMKEVELTAQCLMTNPKSYGAWHHRHYSLDQMRWILRQFIVLFYDSCVVPLLGNRNLVCVTSS